MANAAPVRALALRLTRTDACGAPVPEATANSRITTAGFISVGLASDVFTSSDIQVAAASGAICVRDKGVPSLLGYDVTLQLCNFNESILEMLLGASILTTPGPPTVSQVGGVIGSDGSFNDNTVMVEWWSRNGNNDACAGGGGAAFLHWVLPRVNRWVLSGNIDIGDSATTVTLQGYAEPTTAFAESRVADQWTAADVTAINAARGVLAWREVTSTPATTAFGYDV